MKAVFEEIRHNRLLWLLVFVPVLFAAEAAAVESPTLLFVLVRACDRSAGGTA